MIDNPYSYVFPFMPELTNPVVSLISVGIEYRMGTEYYYDNKDRMLNGYLFQYTLSGSGILCIGEKEYEIQPSEAFFIPIPSDTRYFCNLKKRERWEFMYFLIQSDFLREYYNLITGKASNIMTMPADSSPIQFLQEIINLTRNGHITNFNTASSLAFDFINRLYYYHMDNSENYSKRNREIMHYLDYHFSDLDSIEKIAEMYNISLSHLSREFAKDTGLSPIKYLTKVRVQNAKKLLQTTMLPVTEIGKLCGYNQTNYFCKVFKENVGQSPMQYRNCIN